MRRTTSAALAIQTLAQTEEADGHLPVAESLLREGIDIVTEKAGYDSAAQIDLVDALAQVLRHAGRTGEADALSARAAEIRRKSGQVSSAPVGGTAPAVRIEKKNDKP
jgi:hypothetical protein